MGLYDANDIYDLFNEDYEDSSLLEAELEIDIDEANDINELYDENSPGLTKGTHFGIDDDVDDTILPEDETEYYDEDYPLDESGNIMLSEGGKSKKNEEEDEDDDDDKKSNDKDDEELKLEVDADTENEENSSDKKSKKKSKSSKDDDEEDEDDDDDKKSSDKDDEELELEVDTDTENEESSNDKKSKKKSKSSKDDDDEEDEDDDDDKDEDEKIEKEEKLTESFMELLESSNLLNSFDWSIKPVTFDEKHIRLFQEGPEAYFTTDYEVLKVAEHYDFNLDLPATIKMICEAHNILPDNLYIINEADATQKIDLVEKGSDIINTMGKDKPNIKKNNKKIIKPLEARYKRKRKRFFGKKKLLKNK